MTVLRAWFDWEDTTPSPTNGGHVTRGERTRAPDFALGAIVMFLGLIEAATFHATPHQNRLWFVGIGIAVGVAAGLSRRAPSAALAVMWGVYALQIAADVPLMLIELSVIPVAFGCARWGHLKTVWASGISIPLSAVIVVVYVKLAGIGTLVEVTGYRNVLQAAHTLGPSWDVTAAAFAGTVLGLPWLAGLALRYAATAQVSATLQIAAEEDAARALRDAEQAREIADLREGQARLARDVHDVVGHSLAVILAQAESAHYVPDTDIAALRNTMANIATAARSSLQDVRGVLTATGDRLPVVALGVGGPESLIHGMRTSGYAISYSEVGDVRTLFPELDVVAFRVLQEMMTNAIKHGRRGSTITVKRLWQDDLQIEVSNVVGDPCPRTGETAEHEAMRRTGGHGLDGMRRRLESVGGRLETRRNSDTADGTFTARAWVPVRAATERATSP